MNTEEKGEMGNCQLVRDVDKALLELCEEQGLEPVRLDAEGRALMARVVDGEAMGDIGSMNSQLITSGQEVYFSCVTIHEQGLCIEMDQEYRFIPYELATKQEETGKSRHDEHVSDHLETLGIGELARKRADSGRSSHKERVAAHMESLTVAAREGFAKKKAKARAIRELEEAASILQEAGQPDEPACSA